MKALTPKAPPRIDAEWLKAEDVAGIVSMSVRTLWRLVAANKFPQPVRMNRKLVRWKRSDVYEHLGLPVPPPRPLYAAPPSQPPGRSPYPAGESPAALSPLPPVAPRLPALNPVAMVTLLNKAFTLVFGTRIEPADLARLVEVARALAVSDSPGKEVLAGS